MSEHTPGPWIWLGNVKTRQLWLCTPDRGRTIVMDFVRWGMNGARPRFRIGAPGAGDRANAGIMRPADHEAPGPDHNGQFVEINHPDARLIAAAPELLDALEDALEFVRDVYHFEDEEGGRPFNTCDYYRMEDLIKRFESTFRRAGFHLDGVPKNGKIGTHGED